MNSGADLLANVCCFVFKEVRGVIYNLYFLRVLLFMLNLQYRDVH